MNAVWTGLSARERLMVAGAAALIGGTLFILLVVAPVFEWRASAARRLETAERTYALVAEAARRGPSAKAASATMDLKTATRSVVFQTADQARVSLAFVNAIADDRVTISADGVDPDRFFAWLGVLERRYGVTVENADLARDPRNPGRISVKATLGRVG
ncbi:MAG: type II secretion system protein M [Pseudomonadota bacterium]